MKLNELRESLGDAADWFDLYVGADLGSNDSEHMRFLELVEQGADTSDWSLEITANSKYTVFDPPIKIEKAGRVQLEWWKINDTSKLPEVDLLKMQTCEVGPGFGAYLAKSAGTIDLYNTKMTREDVVDVLSTGKYFRYWFQGSDGGLSGTQFMVVRRNDGTIQLRTSVSGGQRKIEDEFELQDFILNTAAAEWFLD